MLEASRKAVQTKAAFSTKASRVLCEQDGNSWSCRKLCCKMPALQRLFRRTPLKTNSQEYEQPALQKAHMDDNNNEWPEKPQTVERARLWSLFEIFIDTLLSGCCFLFLGFALLVRAFDGKRVEDHDAFANGLVAATRYVSQLWYNYCSLEKRLLTSKGHDRLAHSFRYGRWTSKQNMPCLATRSGREAWCSRCARKQH